LEKRGIVKLVAFDLDGTLTKVESIWQFIHQALGTWTAGSAYAQMFHRGEISYERWAELDASLWRGLPLKRLEDVTASVEYTAGARDVVESLKLRGVKVGVISAGLSVLCSRAQRELDLDFAEGNELEVEGGQLTGRVTVRVPFDGKGVVLRAIKRRFGVDSQGCAAVGDDMADLGLFEEAGLRIAFNPKCRELEDRADFTVRSKDLRAILTYIP